MKNANLDKFWLICCSLCSSFLRIYVSDHYYATHTSLTSLSLQQPSELGVKQSRPRASDAECANLPVQSNSNIDGFSQDVLVRCGHLTDIIDLL